MDGFDDVMLVAQLQDLVTGDNVTTVTMMRLMIPPSQPSDVKTSRVGSDMIELIWSWFPRNEPGISPVPSAYSVYMVEDNGDATVVATTGCTLSATIGPLNPSTQYSFVVTASNQIGEGFPSSNEPANSTAIVLTKPLFSTEPTMLAEDSDFATSIRGGPFGDFIDFDGDGDLDLFTNPAFESGDHIVYYENVGSSQFRLRQDVNPFNISAALGEDVLLSPVDVLFVDLDQNGLTDAVFSFPSAKFLNSEVSSHEPIYFYNIGGNTSCEVTSSENCTTDRVFTRNSSLFDNPLSNASLGYHVESPSFFDYDGDGLLDMFADVGSSGSIHYFRQNAENHFEKQPDSKNPFFNVQFGSSNTASVYFQDLDVDGDLDAIFIARLATVVFYENLDDGTGSTRFMLRTETENPLSDISTTRLYNGLCFPELGVMFDTWIGASDDVHAVGNNWGIYHRVVVPGPPVGNPMPSLHCALHTSLDIPMRSSSHYITSYHLSLTIGLPHFIRK